MSFRIIFTDIDGTLLNKDRELSPFTIEVIHKLQDKVPVVLISSRMPDAMRHLQHQLKIAHQPLICYNGGLVLVDDKIVSSTEIPLSTIERIHQFNKKLQCHISLYHNDEWYVPLMDSWAKREESNTKVTPTILPMDEVLLKWKQENKGAHKVMCMGDEAHIDAIVELLLKTNAENLHLYRSKPTYLEIADKRVSKLTGINILLKDHINLHLKDAVAFGDNFNDIEMLQGVGMGIAVENAKPEVLEIAKEIALHAKEDGVAKSIIKIFALDIA